MKVVFLVKQLKQDLTALRMVAVARGTLPILRCVRIAVEADGGVTLMATDLDCTLVCRCKEATAIPTPGPVSVAVHSVALHAEDLWGAVSGTSAARIAVDFVAGEAAAEGAANVKATITWLDASDATTSTQELSGYPEAEWPEPRTVEKRKDVPDTFLPTFRRLAGWTADHESRATIFGVILDPTGGPGKPPVPDKPGYVRANMVGTDGRRMIHAPMSLPRGTHPCCVRVSKFLMWSKLPAEGLRIGTKLGDMSGPLFCLESERYVYTQRCTDGASPNWRMVANQPENDKLRSIALGPKDITSILANLSKYTKAKAMEVSVHFGWPADGKLEMHLHAKGAVDALSRVSLVMVDSVVTGRSGASALNAWYFRQLLESGARYLSFKDECSPIFATGLVEGNPVTSAIVMPIRIA